MRIVKPYGCIEYKRVATHIGTRTQPWLAGYVGTSGYPWMAKPRRKYVGYHSTQLQPATRL
jgi:hypothetical protein